MDKTYRVILDTDPGVDDTMAIYFALRSEKIDLMALTTVFGNVHTSLASENALRVLEIAGREDIPVYHGAEKPLVGEYGGPVAFVHGENGQGNIPLSPPAGSTGSAVAAEYIADTVMGNPGEITLVGVGPLTNFALALELQPKIVQAVREVIVMGGNAFCPGNATPFAEANIHNDPEAADLVFSAGWPVTMVGLDVTHRVHMTNAHLARFSQLDDPLARHVANIVVFYRDFFQQTMGIDGIYVHDSSALAYLLDRSLFQTEQWSVSVDTTMTPTRGNTVPGKKGDGSGRPGTAVCVGVDGDSVVELLFRQ